MKKLFLTIAIVFALSMSCFSQDGGLFKRGYDTDEIKFGKTESLTQREQKTENQKDNEAPVGAGSLLLIGFASAYAMYKKNKK